MKSEAFKFFLLAEIYPVSLKQLNKIIWHIKVLGPEDYNFDSLQDLW